MQRTLSRCRLCTSSPPFANTLPRNRGYPYNPGDLKDSIAVANNYLEGQSIIPWDDLRYLFGEIFYGGHITDNYDRVLCEACLAAYVKVDLLEGNMPLFAGFATPPGPLNYKGYFEYIDDSLDRETPLAYGLHPNAEVNFMTNQANQLFRNINNMSPKTGGGGEGGMTITEKVKQILDDILEKCATADEPMATLLHMASP